eukprot:m.3512 g.3512  ORF g.3512 m.3512 type:complete len:68 (+) comp2853_c0_seq1:49-252(+)
MCGRECGCVCICQHKSGGVCVSVIFVRVVVRMHMENKCTGVLLCPCAYVCVCVSVRVLVCEYVRVRM